MVSWYGNSPTSPPVSFRKKANEPQATEGNGARLSWKNSRKKAFCEWEFDGDLSIAPWFGGNEISSFWISMYFYPNSFFWCWIFRSSLSKVFMTSEVHSRLLASQSVWHLEMYGSLVLPKETLGHLCFNDLCCQATSERLFSAFPTHKSRSSLPLKPKKDRDNS